MKKRDCLQCGKPLTAKYQKKFCGRGCAVTYQRGSQHPQYRGVGLATFDEGHLFWAQVECGADDDCWLWTGRVDYRSYGVVCVEGVNRRAHRVAYVLTHGAIPDGMFVCHRCDVPACVNPAHLFAGTPSDNVQDMIAKRRNRPPRGDRSGHAKLTWPAVREIREEAARGVKQVTLARRFGVDPSSISNVVREACWREEADA